MQWKNSPDPSRLVRISMSLRVTMRSLSAAMAITAVPTTTTIPNTAGTTPNTPALPWPLMDLLEAKSPSRPPSVSSESPARLLLAPPTLLKEFLRRIFSSGTSASNSLRFLRDFLWKWDKDATEELGRLGAECSGEPSGTGSWFLPTEIGDEQDAAARSLLLIIGEEGSVNDIGIYSNKDFC